MPSTKQNVGVGQTVYKGHGPERHKAWPGRISEPNCYSDCYDFRLLQTSVAANPCRYSRFRMGGTGFEPVTSTV